MAIVFGLFAVYSIFVVGGEEIVLDYQTMTFIDYLKLVGVAGITSITFALPGFDFAILLLALGYYYPLMELIKNLASFTDFIPNGLILLTYVSGYLIGILILSKLIKRFMSRHEGKMKFITLAFVLVSPYMVIKKSIVDNPYLLYTNNHIIIGVIGAVIGFLLVLLIYHFNNPNDTRIEAQKKRHMFRFYFTILCQFPLTIHYLKSMRKIIKEQKTSFDERYLFVQKGVAKINRLGNISLHAYGEEVIPTDVTLYVVNHQGRYDGIGILSALKDHPCSFIVDATKVKYPFYKEMSIMLECTAIDVDNPRSVVSGLKEVALQLEKGRSYIAFIEGTYGNNENNLQEFKTSVLKPAYDAKVAITPVVLYDTYKVYGKSSIRRVQPEVHFLKPISYSEYQDLTRSELAEQLKALMQIKLDDIKTEKNEFNKRKRK